MRARLFPMGEDAVLVEVDGTPEAVALRDALRDRVGAATTPATASAASGAEPWGRVLEVVGAARTVLVRAREADLHVVGRAVLELADGLDPAGGLGAGGVPPVDPVVEVLVRYDGPDLDEVGRLTGLGREGVVAAHTGTPWQVGFGGFSPGFAYLVGGDPRLEVPRRADPRPRVPAGSVGLAGPFSGVYPQASPGGWQLLGRTDALLWDVDRDPPALLRPGASVRFVDAATRPQDSTTATPAGRRTAGRRRHAVAAGSAGPGALEVLRAGPATLVQDLGRPGLADLGVGRSGAADRSAYLLGLRLLGHDAGVEVGAAPASLEVTLGGLAVRALGDLTVALTGAPAPASVDGRPVPHGAPLPLRNGQVLELGTPSTGLRTYVAVRGGVAAAPVLGSGSTDTLSGLGPPPVAAGDVLAVGRAPERFPVVDHAPVDGHRDEVRLSLLPGPRTDWCHADDLVASPLTVAPDSNRVGLRLRGAAVRRRAAFVDRELPSEPLVRGAVQVPPGGEPVLFLADHPVSGGYPVVAVVVAADVDRASQLRPGDRIHLRWRHPVRR